MCPDWECHGIDLSDEALELARKNAASNDLDVHFHTGDLFNLGEVQKPDQGWDIIVSNPPYIGPDEKPSLEKQVKDHEPSMALFHDNPLEVYRSIIAYARREEALLFLELNDRLADKILEISTEYYPSASVKQDLDKNPRFLIAAPAS
jgi:release factor glutamine methyltransferase